MTVCATCHHWACVRYGEDWFCLPCWFWLWKHQHSQDDAA